MRRCAFNFCCEWRLFDYVLCVVLALVGLGVGRLVRPFCRNFSWTDPSIAASYGGAGTFPSWTLALISILPGVFYIVVEALCTFMCEGAGVELDECSPPPPPPPRLSENIRRSESYGVARRQRVERRDFTESQDTIAPDGVPQREITHEESERAHPTGGFVTPPRRLTKQWLFLYTSNHWILAQAFSVTLTMFIVDIMKVYAGRLRPDFLARLERAGYSPGSVNVNWCEVARGGRLSFPSGHSGISFAAFVPFTLYCLSRIGAFRGLSLWRVVVGMLPLFLPFIVAVSRTRDNRHHFSDILAGSIIGATSGILAVKFLFVLPPRTATLRVRQLEFIFKRYESTAMDNLV